MLHSSFSFPRAGSWASAQDPSWQPWATNWDARDHVQGLPGEQTIALAQPTFQWVLGQAQLPDDVPGQVCLDALPFAGMALRGLQQVVKLLGVKFLETEGSTQEPLHTPQPPRDRRSPHPEKPSSLPVDTHQALQESGRPRNDDQKLPDQLDYEAHLLAV